MKTRSLSEQGKEEEGRRQIAEGTRAARDQAAPRILRERASLLF